MMRRLLPCVGLFVGLTACSSPSKPPSQVQPTAPEVETDPPPPREASPESPAATELLAPEPRRVIAVGDLHGDFAAARAALLAAGVVDEEGAWTGGETVLVQTGDVLDRGDGEQAIMDWLISLQGPARTAGGEVVLLNGNHEAMNVMGDLRYVTPGGFADFEDAPGVSADGVEVAAFPENQRARVAAFRPGGPYAKKLAENRTIAIVGDSLFVHGGVLPRYATQASIDEINSSVSGWMRGDTPLPPAVLDPNGPFWSRHFSLEPDESDCALLAQSLASLKVRRMVVGHTVHLEGVTSACNKQVWMIDTGMSAYYGGKPAALLIDGETVRPLMGK